MRILFMTTALLVAFGAGFLVARLTIEPAAGPIRVAPTTKSADVVRQIPERPSDLVATPEVSSPAVRQSFPTLRAAALLATKRLQNGSHVPPFTFERLNPDFITLYELSPAEIERLEVAAKRVRAQVASIEAAKAQLAPQSDGTVRITIEPYPREGGALLDALRAEVLTTLGEERSEFFRSLSDFDGSNSTEFGGFGLRQTVVEVRALGPNGPGSMRGTTSFDPATSLQTMTTETDFRSLKDSRPELYARLVGAGLAR